MLLVTLLLIVLGPLAVQLFGMASLVCTMALLTVPISGDLSCWRRTLEAAHTAHCYCISFCNECFYLLDNCY
jgi:hypothetical protein